MFEKKESKDNSLCKNNIMSNNTKKIFIINILWDIIGVISVLSRLINITTIIVWFLVKSVICFILMFIVLKEQKKMNK